MNVPIFALFLRSLMVESRLLSTYMMRLGLVAIMVFGVIAAHAASSRIGAPGLALFSTTLFVNFFFISLIGLNYFSSVITEEKEDMTLGLLRMTSLSPVVILMGKSTSRLVGIIFLLAAQFPFTYLSVTLGGVSMLQVNAAYVTLLSYIIFINNLALFFSVFHLNTQKSAGSVLAFMLMFFFGPYMMKGLLAVSSEVDFENLSAAGGIVGGLSILMDWIIDTSPFNRLRNIVTTGFSGNVINLQVIANLCYGLFFFLMAWLGFETFTREQKKSGPSKGLFARKKRGLKRFFGISRPWKRAVAWKDFNFIAGGRTIFTAKAVIMGIVGVIAAIGFQYEDGDLWNEGTGIVLMVISLIGIGLDFVYYLSMTFQQEVRWRTLSSIKMLPRSTSSLAFEKVIGGLPGLLVWCIYFFLGALLHPDGFIDGFEEIFTIYTVEFLSVYAFFVYLSVYLSLKLKRASLLVAFLFIIVGYWMSRGIIEFMFFMRGSSSGDIARSIAYITVLLLFCFFLHRGIGRRLEILAAE